MMRTMLQRSSVLLLSGLLLCGCVERRMTITSTVPARVYLDRVDVGETPVVVLFENYGKREYTLRADGYQTTSGEIELEAPWYEYPFIDIVAQVLFPLTIVDRHSLHVEMKPIGEPHFEGLRDRAREYRESTLRDIAPKGE